MGKGGNNPHAGKGKIFEVTGKLCHFKSDEEKKTRGGGKGHRAKRMVGGGVDYKREEEKKLNTSRPPPGTRGTQKKVNTALAGENPPEKKGEDRTKKRREKSPSGRMRKSATKQQKGGPRGYMRGGGKKEEGKMVSCERECDSKQAKGEKCPWEKRNTQTPGLGTPTDANSSTQPGRAPSVGGTKKSCGGKERTAKDHRKKGKALGGGGGRTSPAFTREKYQKKKGKTILYLGGEGIFRKKARRERNRTEGLSGGKRRTKKDPLSIGGRSTRMEARKKGSQGAWGKKRLFSEERKNKKGKDVRWVGPDWSRGDHAREIHRAGKNDRVFHLKKNLA